MTGGINCMLKRSNEQKKIRGSNDVLKQRLEAHFTCKSIANVSIDLFYKNNGEHFWFKRIV
jgi:hypothetical protein